MYLSLRLGKRLATTFPPWSQDQSRLRSLCHNLTRDVKTGKLIREALFLKTKEKTIKHKCHNLIRDVKIGKALKTEEIPLVLGN